MGRLYKGLPVKDNRGQPEDRTGGLTKFNRECTSQADASLICSVTQYNAHAPKVEPTRVLGIPGAESRSEFNC